MSFFNNILKGKKDQDPKKEPLVPKSNNTAQPKAKKNKEDH